TFEKLDSCMEFVLSCYINSQMQLKIGSTINDFYHQIEQQSREAFVSNKVSSHLNNDVNNNDRKRKQPYEDIEELQEEVNYLFEEGNKSNIILTIDDKILSDELMLNINATEKSSYTNDEIKGDLDLTKESLFNCKEIDDDILKHLSKEFTNLSNENKKFKANIQYIIANIDIFKRSVTEEVLKMTTMYPFYYAVINSDFLLDRGEIQSYSTKAQNEDANLFQKTRISRKVDMIGNLKETSFKVEALFGEVSGGLGLEINVYALKWKGNSIYLFGLVDKGTLPSSENEYGLFEDLYCIFKELERKLKKTEEKIKNLNLLNVRSKRRNLGVKSIPELNLNRTPN
ncbi:18896_t:CDS:2, partial [Funneliformis geosporum]